MMTDANGRHNMVAYLSLPLTSHPTLEELYKALRAFSNQGVPNHSLVSIEENEHETFTLSVEWEIKPDQFGNYK